MRALTRRASLTLICLIALTPAAYSQSGDQTLKPRPSGLYQVRAWDEKSGAYRIGFIDNTGRLVIGFDRLPKATNYVGEFHEGRAVIQLDESSGGRVSLRVGYIDGTGAVVIETRFTFAREFHEGLAFVRGYGFQGFIDRDGKEVIKVSDDFSPGDFHEGLATVNSIAALTALKDSWGYIDRSGRLAIKPQYAFADDFSEGLAGVEIGGRVGFINRKGEMIVPPRFEPRKGNHATVAAGRFSEGLAYVKVSDAAYGYINKKGEFVLPPRFYRAQDFSEGLAWVAGEGGKVGWIDKTGRWAVTGLKGLTVPGTLLLSYASESEALKYSEGLVPFHFYSDLPMSPDSPLGRNLNGYMNQKGEVVIQPREIYSPGPFRSGLARVLLYEKVPCQKGKSGLIEATGQCLEEKLAYIDRTGRFVWRAP